ncbi:MAG: single-stranded DNA-binding protein [Spirochaetales bacterium]|nr:single-stranded DNA-binding protein [Spirochaetales bacterium]
MTDVNSVVLIGRLTRDAELKYTSAGMAISNFSLAVNRSRKVGDRWEEEASFFDCTAFGKQAEAVNQYMTKGKQVAVQGELRQDRWEKDGQSRSKVVIIANTLQLLGGASGSSGASGGSKNTFTRRDQAEGGEGEPAYSDGNFEDDIPF